MQDRPRAFRACLSRVPRRVARTVLRGPGRSNAPRLPDRDIRMVKLQQKISARHEAPHNRVEVKGLRHWPVAAGW